MGFKDFIQNYDVVVWDWNGTLLNDLEHTHAVISHIMQEEGLGPISVQDYRNHFRFPISSYYSSLGLPSKGSDFERVSHQFIETYKSYYKQLNLFEDSIELLNSAQALGVNQYVLSAAHSEELKKLLKQFNIESYFNDISGASDIYAHGKIDQAKSMKPYFNKQGYQKGVYIGDTDHDYEVSQVLGFDFCFSAKGHQPLHRLEGKKLAYVLRPED